MYFFLKFVITNNISIEMSFNEIYNLMNAHTLPLLISRVCIYKHNLFISIYILRRKKFMHTPNVELFYIIAFHAYLYFSAVTNLRLLSSSSMNSLQPVDAYMCQESSLAFVKIMDCRLISAESFSN